MPASCAVRDGGAGRRGPGCGGGNQRLAVVVAMEVAEGETMAADD